MKKLMLVLCITVMLSGCTWFVPSEIKTEIQLVDTMVVQAVKDIQAEEDPKKMAERALRAFIRIAPHTDNMNRWIEGRPAAKTEE